MNFEWVIKGIFPFPMICGVVVVIVFGLSYKENGPPGEMFYGLCARRSFCGLKEGGFFRKNGSWGVFMGWEFLNFLAKRGGVCEGLKSWLNLRGLTIFISRIRLRPSLRPFAFFFSTLFPFFNPFSPLFLQAFSSTHLFLLQSRENVGPVLVGRYERAVCPYFR